MSEEQQIYSVLMLGVTMQSTSLYFFPQVFISLFVLGSVLPFSDNEWVSLVKTLTCRSPVKEMYSCLVKDNKI